MNALVEKLRNRRISVTPQRLAVLTVLEKSRTHPTAEQIFQEVRRDMPAISFNTVYKTLEVLCQRGLVIKVNPLHEVARYDIDTGEHAHLVCRRCHHIVDLHDLKVPIPPLPAHLEGGFRVDGHSLFYWGLCPSCQHAETEQSDIHKED
uniref:Transcriptional repressor n=1 Tax=Desulfobacca acetoxidans TaxID=60893 RepID=A0A7V4LBT4_9BACT